MTRCRLGTVVRLGRRVVVACLLSMLSEACPLGLFLQSLRMKARLPNCLWCEPGVKCRLFETERFRRGRLRLLCCPRLRGQPAAVLD